MSFCLVSIPSNVKKWLNPSGRCDAATTTSRRIRMAAGEMYVCSRCNLSAVSVVEPICIPQKISATITETSSEHAYRPRSSLYRDYMYAGTQQAWHFVDSMLPQSQARLSLKFIFDDDGIRDIQTSTISY
jgi:hypothetical protein